MNRVDYTGEWGKDLHQGYTISNNTEAEWGWVSGSWIKTGYKTTGTLRVSALSNGQKYGTYYWLTKDSNPPLLGDYAAIFVADACYMVDQWFSPMKAGLGIGEINYNGGTSGGVPTASIIINPPSRKNQQWHFNVYEKNGTWEYGKKGLDSRDVCYLAAALTSIDYVMQADYWYNQYKASGKKSIVYLEKYIDFKIKALTLIGMSMHPMQDKESHTYNGYIPYKGNKDKDAIKNGTTKYYYLADDRGFWWHGLPGNGVDSASKHWYTVNNRVRPVTRDIMTNYKNAYRNTSFFNDSGTFESYVKNAVNSKSYTLKINA